MRCLEACSCCRGVVSEASEGPQLWLPSAAPAAEHLRIQDGEFTTKIVHPKIHLAQKRETLKPKY